MEHKRPARESIDCDEEVLSGVLPKIRVYLFKSLGRAWSGNKWLLALGRQVTLTMGAGLYQLRDSMVDAGPINDESGSLSCTIDALVSFMQLCEDGWTKRGGNDEAAAKHNQVIIDCA
ncbi:MAG: hypothetical protein AAF483_25810 [Planctomycetota bacterium]